MIYIQQITCNMFQENCYIVHDDSSECIIIDCGAYYQQEKQAISKYIKDKQLKPVHLLATHGHIDHHFGDAFVEKEYGLLPEVHHADQFLMQNLHQQAEVLANIRWTESIPKVKRYLTKTDSITFGTHTLSIIETPGHSPGSIFFYCKDEHVAFTGDTLFKYSIGRTDLQGGSMFQMIQSLRMISQLPDQTKVYPGHGPCTTIGTEVAGNPYLDR